MKKIIILALGLGFSHIAVKAQMIPQDKKWQTDSGQQELITSTINTSKYIFEGSIVEAKSYSSSGQLYTMQIIKIHKIFKGNLTCGTIKIIAKGGYKDTHKFILGHCIGGKGSVATFFCNLNSFPETSEKIMPTDNSIVLQPINWIEYTDFQANYIGQLTNYQTFVRFKTFDGLYQKLLQKPDLQMQRCDNMDFQLTRDSLIKSPPVDRIIATPQPNNKINNH